MRVLLINPPAYEGVKIVREGRCMQREGAWTASWSPLSLAFVASVLRNEGCQVKINDCTKENISFSDLGKIVREYKPDFMVINTGTPSIDSDLLSAKILKENNPDAKCAAIGIHVTVLPDESLGSQEALDFVVRGEPEYTVRDLVLNLSDPNRVRQIEGISYRDDGKIIHNPDRKPIDDLDRLPFPSWDLVDRKKYIMPFTDRKFLLVATSRGCPFNCVFCADSAYYGKKLRKRSPGRIVDEMEWIKNEFGIEDFLFWAESFTLDERYAFDVADEIVKRGDKFRWVCNSRVDNVSPGLLKKFKEAGCWMVGYGVESGSQRVLDLMDKKIEIEKIKDAVKITKEAKLDVTAHCVLGFPGETRDEVLKTVQMVTDLDVDFAQFYCVSPFPGSELYEKAKENGWIVNDDWTKFEQNFSVLDTEYLKADEIMRLRKFAYRKFYFRPKVILRMLKKYKKLSNLKYIFRMVKGFLNWV